MSSFRTNRLIFAIGAVIIGIILLVWPDVSLVVIGRCIGAVLAVGGLVAGFLSFKDRESLTRTLLLLMAAVMLICGIVIVIHPEELVKLIPTIAGALAVISGMINVGETILLSRNKYGKWWISLLAAALKIAAGIFVVRNAFVLVETIARVAGGVMIFCGGSDLWVLSRLFVAEKKVAQENKTESAKDGAENAGADASVNADAHPAEPESSAPGLVPDGDRTDAGPAEVPEYMQQEEQPGEYENS